MRQTARRMRVEDVLDQDPNMAQIRAVLRPEEDSVGLDDPPPQMSTEEQIEFLAKHRKPLSEWAYTSLLHYLHATNRPLRSVADAQVVQIEHNECLPVTAYQPFTVSFDDRVYSCSESHFPNSQVQYRHPLNHTIESGSITAIWVLPIKDGRHTFFLVTPHMPLPPNEDAKAPFVHMSSRYSVRIFNAISTVLPIIIEPKHIISHVSTYRRPEGTYQIPLQTIVVCTALNRGRR